MNRFHKLLAAVLFAGFAAGISHLMTLRFDRGDVYPAYSSLRSDPVGTRAFFDSLESLDGIRVARNFRPLKSLNLGEGSTLFFVGAGLRAANTIPLEEARALDNFMSSGGRVVITMMPAVISKPDQDGHPGKKNAGADAESKHKKQEPEAVPQNGDSGPADAEKTRDGSDSAGKKNPADDLETKRIHTTLKAQWGIVVETDPEPEDPYRNDATGYAALQSGPLPRVLSWHSPVYFNELSDAWKTLYEAGGRAVMVERDVGQGSLVLATDSYFMSNEALKTERYPGLLLYLIGGNLTVIVDETHHGIHRKQNMIGYLRHYRLHWVLIALLSVAGLFVWRNALPLVPPDRHRMDHTARAAETRDAAQGLTNLLRRSISPQRLIGVCFDQWEKAFGNSLRYPQTRRERARRIIEQAGTASDATANPVNGYRAIRRILLEDQPHE